MVHTDEGGQGVGGPDAGRLHVGSSIMDEGEWQVGA